MHKFSRNKNLWPYVLPAVVKKNAFPIGAWNATGVGINVANLQNLQAVHHVEMHIRNAKTQAYQATLKDRVVHCGAGTTHQWGLRQARRPHSAMSEHQQKKMLSAGNTSSSC
jgi:hypothetical protein